MATLLESTTMTTVEASTSQLKAELSIQGDDFTRQMWQMYAVFEELLERQLGSADNSRNPRRSEAYKRRFNSSEVYEDNSLEDFDVWSMAVAAPQELGDADDPFSGGDFDTASQGQELRCHENINEELLNQLEAAFHRQLILGGGAEYVSDEVLDRSGRSEENTNRHSMPYHRYRRRHHSLHKDYALKQEHEEWQEPEEQGSLRRHYKHGHRRRLPATPLKHQQQSHSILSQVPSSDVEAENLTRSSPAVNVESPTELDDSNESLSSSFTLAKQQQSSIPYRRSSAPELLDNPLLETISSIEDMCESDDYGELPQVKRSGSVARDEHSGGLCVTDKDGFQNGKRSCLTLSSGEHSQPDLDRDSVGYAGSNSVDSGYKSSCPTPELLDPCYYAQDALCGGSSSSANKRALLSSAIRANRETKPRIPMGTRVIGRHTRSSSTPWSTLLSTSSCSSSSSGGATSGGDGCSTPNRLEYGYYDVNLDHLMYLRQSLLSAIQKCGGSVSSMHASHSDMEGSGALTGNTCASVSDSSGSTSRCGTGGSSIHTSPARSRSGSRTSRGSPDLFLGSQSKSLRFAMDDCKGGNVASDLSEYEPNVPSASNDDNGGCGHATVVTGSSAAMLAPSCSRLNTDCIEDSLACNMSEKDPIGLHNVVMSKTPSLKTDTIVGCAAVSNEEAESVMLDRAEYYDLESVEDFPCSYGTVLENKYLQSSVARVKKLKVDPKYDNLKTKRLTSCYKPTFEQSSSQRVLPQALSDSETCDPQRHNKSRKSDRAILNVALHANHAEDYGNQHLNCISSSSAQSQNAKSSVSSDVAVDQARFSQVASCMLKIIDDLHQHQQQNAVSPTKKPQESSTLSAQSYRAKLNSSSAVYDSQRLSGADYHVYEEIAYDLINRDGKSTGMVPGQRVIGRRGADNLPPPLPARPNQIFGSTSVSSPTKKVKPSKTTNNKAVSQFSLEPNVPEQRKKVNLKKRGNLYSIFTEQSDRRHLSQSLEKEWQTCNPRGTIRPSATFGEVSSKSSGNCNVSNVAAASYSKESNDDDEYGFNVIAK